MNTQCDDDLDMADLIEQHLQELQAEGASEDTVRSRGRCLRRLHDDLPFGIAYATREQIAEWLAYDRWSAWTRYTYAGHIFEFCRWAHAIGALPEDPTAGLRRPRQPASLPRPATDAEWALVLAAPEPILTAGLLAGLAGLRRKEIVGTAREHITKELIIIPRAKGGDPQTVPCHPAIWEHVRDRPPGPLLVDRRGRPMTREQLSATVSRWARSVGLNRWGLHRLRHRFGTEIQREYRDLRVTQECLRHRSVTSTQVYTQVTDQQRRAAITSLPWIGHRPGVGRPVPDAED